MKAVQVLGSEDSPSITLTDTVPKPSPRDGQILIKVVAAGLTADELTWPEVYKTETKIPGHDISGVVEALGPNYNGPLSVGDSVFVMLPTDAALGGLAEYTVASPEHVALKPASISHAEAAALPIPVLTAWEAIFEHAKLARGSKVLVTGASGAVGVWLVQLAHKLLDAEVIGLCSPQKGDFVKGLGASTVVSYHLPDWQDTVKDVDAVFDTVGGSTLSKSWSSLKTNGTVVTVGDPAPSWAYGGKPQELETHPDAKWIYFIVKATGHPLSKVAALIDNGTVRAAPVETFPADKAVEAWEYAAKRNRLGKVVIEF